MRPSVLAAAVVIAFSGPGLICATEPLRSGLQPGERLNSVFEPLNVTGPAAGEPHCLVCENGASPVVMIFAREPSAQLVRLLTKIDAATGKNRSQEMGSFVVFLSEKNGLAEQLKEVAKKEALKHVVLSIDAPAGPDGFKVAADAEVTVVLYCEHKVLANHAFRKGELSDAAIEKIIADVPKILQPK